MRLLRLVRLGDLGAIDASWDGWVLNRNGLWSPDGKRYSEPAMRLWWLTSEQARFWRQAYDARNCVTRYENRGAAVAASAAERLEGASRGAAVQHLTGESLSCPALAKRGRARFVQGVCQSSGDITDDTQLFHGALNQVHRDNSLCIQRSGVRPLRNHC